MDTNITRHSKYKNTGIVFELLVRQITSDMMRNQESESVRILKKFYNKKSELLKELNLYKVLYSTKNLNESKGSIIIDTVLEQSKKLDREKLNKEKYNIVKEIKLKYNIDDFFKNKVKDYKIYASIYTLLEIYNNASFKNTDQLLTNKINILEHITSPEVKSVDADIDFFMNQDKEIRILSFRILLEKFNSQYQSLIPDQKMVLKEYIYNISDTVTLKKFFNTKFQEIKKVLSECINKIDDKVTKIKIQELIEVIKPILPNQSIKDEHAISLMHYYELIKELKVVIDEKAK
jgi:hypothetical protein